MAFWNWKKSIFSLPEFKEGDAKGFWQWFSQNEVALASGFKAYFAGQHQNDAHGEALASALNKYHPELAFEMGNPKTGRLDFVVSADGLFANFPAVIQLVTCAPESTYFQFTAFRQRMSDVSLSMFGEEFRPETTQFAIQPSEHHQGKFDLAIFMGEHPIDEKQLRHAAYILLDSTIGEYDMETLIGGFGVFETSTGFETNTHPLTELPGVLDAYLSSLKGN